MKMRTKIVTGIIAFILTCVLLFTVAVINPNTNQVVGASTRTMRLTQTSVDAQSVLNEFDDAKLTQNGTTTYFEGYKPIDKNVLSEIDNISDTELKEYENCIIKYTASYDTETNIIKLAVSTNLSDGSLEIDEINGVGFINDNGEIDAVMDLDGESILLSEMRDMSLIENCGWLSRLIKTVMATTIASVIGVGVAIIAVAVNHVVEESAALSNKKKNSKLTNPTGYINDQSNYTNWGYGLTSLAEGGCGIIAIFNVMQKLQKNPQLADIIYEFDSKSGNLFWGKGGADVTHIRKYFNDRDIHNEFYDKWSTMKNKLKNMTDKQIAICSYWLTRSPINGHYVAVEKLKDSNGNDYFKVYNVGGAYITVYDLDTDYANKIFLNGDFINGYIIEETNGT
ncbi:MAG: hypothetical protein NC033_06485 [Clostridiales bacterium]|nr:hypothetical protein [Clostridiales bacterium]